MEAEKVIMQLINRVEELKQKCITLRQEKDVLLHNKMNLLQEIADKDQRLKDLEAKYNTLQMARAVSVDSEDNEVAKKKLNGLVREIDKCIALLNK